MISNYMLKEVLFHKEKYKDQVEITRLVLNKNYIEYTSDVAGNPYNYITHDKINVYELANKCKEWAYSTYGIMIQSYPYCGKGRADAIKGLKVDEVFKEKTEPEAIFKAAQWVLDNTSTNKLKGH